MATHGHSLSLHNVTEITELRTQVAHLAKLLERAMVTLEEERAARAGRYVRT